MKINETGRIGGINPYQRNIENRDSHLPKKKQVDQVSISLEAKGMLEEYKKIQDPQHRERIAELKEAVSSGTYHVDAGKIAEKLAPYFKSFVESEGKE
ncbi:flagellar biosynthesis anti-sigma factor FlgM [Paenibacillus phocaensis]|uniref:flagellar biosynthesis anti-sigma factor FlgM n=1 Tax=Paenibacillus phocaensis TaxID=1776378 RepID=UPI0003A0DBF0|nr:flagellar biosynthesis anti-sigma factor FlgM [Paenibacillus phocaensis]